MLEIDFKDWFNLTEASYTEEDIPPYFYVSIKFSKDLVKKESYTPPGAICSLVGLEGISESFLSSFFYDKCALKMPAKALLELNKISKINYKNADYLASAGFRSGRRTKAGSGGPEGGKSRHDHQSLFQGIIHSVLNKITSSFPTIRSDEGFGKLKLANSEKTIGASQIVDRLKKLALRSKKTSNYWGQKKKAEDGDLTGKNVKPNRARHFDNNLKNIRNATDLANRLIDVLYDIQDHDKLTSTMITVQGKKIPAIKHYVDEVIRDAFQYEQEKEWVTHRQPLMSHGYTCPHCHTFVSAAETNSKDKTITCPKCNEEFIKKDEQKQVIHKSVLHVPEGSVLYLGKNYGGSLLSWAKKEINDWVKSQPKDEEEKAARIATNDPYKVLVDKYKLYNKFEIHFIEDSDEAETLMKEKKNKFSYNPDAQLVKEKIFSALQRGINRIDVLSKLLEKRDNISSAQLKYNLLKLQKIGAVEINGNNIHLIDSSIQEESIYVYKIVKNHVTGVSKDKISKELGLSIEEIEECLLRLEKENKIQKTFSGLWAIKLNDEEMNSLNKDENDVLNFISQNPDDPDDKRENGVAEYEITDYLSGGEKDATEILSVLKTLMLKNKIFKGPLTGKYKLLSNNNQDLNQRDNLVLDSLKEWPHNNMKSLYKEFEKDNMYSDEIKNIIEKFISLKLVNYDSKDQSVELINHEVKDHKKYSKLDQVILDFYSKHFGRKDDLQPVISYIKNNFHDADIGYYEISAEVDKLIQKGLLKNDQETEYPRLVPTNQHYEKNEETVEVKQILKLLSEHDSLDYNKMYAELGDQINNLDTFLDALASNDIISKTFNPLQDIYFYHLKDKNPNFDYSKYYDLILQTIGSKNKALTSRELAYALNDETSEYLTVRGVNHLLAHLLEKDKVKKAMNLTGKETWYLPTMQPPKDLDHYINIAMNIIDKEKQIKQKTFIEQLAAKENISPDDARQVISKLIYNNGNKVKSEYSELFSDNVVYLSDHPFDVEKETEKIKNEIISLLQQETLTAREIASKFPTYNEYAINEIIANLTDNKKINRIQALKDDKYHVGNDVYPLDKQDVSKILKIVHDNSDNVRGIVINTVLGKESIYHSSRISSFLLKMVELHLLYVFNMASQGIWNCYLSTTPWEGKHNPLESEVIDILKASSSSTPIHGTTIAYKISGMPAMIVNNALDSLLKQHIIQKATSPNGIQNLNGDLYASYTLFNPSATVHPPTPVDQNVGQVQNS